jgi:hypothetical protein
MNLPRSSRAHLFLLPLGYGAESRDDDLMLGRGVIRKNTGSPSYLRGHAAGSRAAKLWCAVPADHRVPRHSLEVLVLNRMDGCACRGPVVMAPPAPPLPVRPRRSFSAASTPGVG